jgi:hypothetical protein
MAVLSSDTTADIEQRQVKNAWRRLWRAERLRLVGDDWRRDGAGWPVSRVAIPGRPNASVSCAWKPRI